MPPTDSKPKDWRWRAHSNFGNIVRAEHSGWYLLPTIILDPWRQYRSGVRKGLRRYSVGIAVRWLAWEWSAMLSRSNDAAVPALKKVTGKD